MLTRWKAVPLAGAVRLAPEAGGGPAAALRVARLLATGFLRAPLQDSRALPQGLKMEHFVACSPCPSRQEGDLSLRCAFGAGAIIVSPLNSPLCCVFTSLAWFLFWFQGCLFKHQLECSSRCLLAHGCCAASSNDVLLGDPHHGK